MSTAWKHWHDLGVSETQALGSGIGNYSESMEAGSFTITYKAVVIQAPTPSLPHLHWLSPALLHSHNTGLFSVPVTLQVSPCSEPLSQILWLPGTPRYRPAGLPPHFTQVSVQTSPPQKASLIVLSEDMCSLWCCETSFCCQLYLSKVSFLLPLWMENSSVFLARVHWKIAGRFLFEKNSHVN